MHSFVIRRWIVVERQATAASILGLVHCLFSALSERLQQIDSLFALILHLLQAVHQSPLGFRPGLVSGRDPIRIVVVDLLESILPASQGFSLVLLRFEVHSRGADKITIVVRLLHGRQRFAGQHLRSASSLRCF